MQAVKESNNNGNFRVLIVGCGELGSRHLQAVASLPEVCEIEVVDPRPEALQLGRERLREIPDLQASTTIRWLSSLEEVSASGDLCIVSTQADSRCQLVNQVAKSLGYSCFLIEKLVCQSIAEYEFLLDFVGDSRLSVWVNCQSRAYQIHKRVRTNIDPTEPVVVNVVGGNHGLATNGIHGVDLFAFYDGATHIETDGSRVDPILHPSKRGRDVFDLSGTLQGSTKKGSHFTLSYAGDHFAPELVTITTPHYRWVVDHGQMWAHESNEATDWVWRPVQFQDNILVSEMTKAFARDIMTSRTCELPTLDECFVAHQFVLGLLLPHFKNLLDLDGDRCPVT